jgi:serine/threonine protein kinase
MAFAAGTRFGVYEITRLIGVGGMGEVHRATDTTLGRPVAVKVLPEQLLSDPERVARFECEAKMLAGLNHPNIATVYGFETGNGAHALVMELVDGLTLAERLEQRAVVGGGAPEHARDPGKHPGEASIQ